MRPLMLYFPLSVCLHEVEAAPCNDEQSISNYIRKRAKIDEKKKKKQQLTFQLPMAFNSASSTSPNHRRRYVRYWPPAKVGPVASPLASAAPSRIRSLSEPEKITAEDETVWNGPSPESQDDEATTRPIETVNLSSASMSTDACFSRLCFSGS